jgi:hypothetical protein
VYVTGLPPKQARLVRFVAWRQRQRRRLDAMEAGKAAFQATIAVPTTSAQRLWLFGWVWIGARQLGAARSEVNIHLT